MSKVKEIDCTTGQEIERDLTDDELAALQAAAESLAAQQQKMAADAQAKADALASAKSKLTALGLTEEEVKAITGQ